MLVKVSEKQNSLQNSILKGIKESALYVTLLY